MNDYGEHASIGSTLVIALVLAGLFFLISSALIEFKASQKSVNEHKPCNEHKDIDCDK